MATQLLTIKGKKVLVSIEQSKIGYSYPRVFIEFSETEYINLDITLRQAFGMKQKDFNDWLADATIANEEDYRTILDEIGINYDMFVESL